MIRSVIRKSARLFFDLLRFFKRGRKQLRIMILSYLFLFGQELLPGIDGVEHPRLGDTSPR